MLTFLAIAGFYAVMSARDRHNTLVGAALLLPYNQYLPETGIPLVNIHTLIMVMLAWGIVRTPARFPGSRPPATVFALMLLGLFLTGAYVHSLTAAIPYATHDLYDGFAVLMTFKGKASVLFVCFAALVIADDLPSTRKTFWACAAAVSLEILFCLIEFLRGSATVSGHFGDRGPAGTFLATYSVVSLGVFLCLRSDWRRWLFLLLCLAGTVGALGARSRGAVLALSAALLVLSLWKSRFLFVLLLIAAATYHSWMPAPILSRFDSAYEVSASGEVELQGTGADRIEIWKAGLRTIPDYPFGIGLGLYAVIVPAYADDASLDNPYKNAHNELVLTTVELGVLGLLAYLWLLFVLGLQAWRVYRRDDDPLMRGMAGGALIGLFGAVLANMVITLLLRAEVSGVLWLVLGMTARRAAELAHAAASRTAEVEAPVEALAAREPA
jgi:O-antigen ligase